MIHPGFTAQCLICVFGATRYLTEDTYIALIQLVFHMFKSKHLHIIREWFKLMKCICDDVPRHIQYKQITYDREYIKTFVYTKNMYFHFRDYRWLRFISKPKYNRLLTPALNSLLNESEPVYEKTYHPFAPKRRYYRPRQTYINPLIQPWITHNPDGSPRMTQIMATARRSVSHDELLSYVDVGMRHIAIAMFNVSGDMVCSRYPHKDTILDLIP